MVVEACSAGAEEGLEERKGKKRTRVYVLCIASIYIQQQPSKQKIEQKIYQRIEEKDLGYSRKPTPQSTNLPTPIYKPQSTNQAANSL